MARGAGQALRMAQTGINGPPVEGRCRPYDQKTLGETQPRWNKPLAGASRRNFVKSSKVIPPDRNFNRPVWRVKKASLGEVLNPGKQVRKVLTRLSSLAIPGRVRSRNPCWTTPG